MVTMGSVWDRTTQVMAGRGGMLAGIAALTIFLPGVVRNAFAFYAMPTTMGMRLVGLILTIATLLLSVWGQLAIIAAASDPATDRPAAQRIATGRLLPAIGVSIVVGVVLILSYLPAIAMLAGSGIDFAAVAAGAQIQPGDVSGGLLALMGLYTLVWLVVLLWLSARLTIWQAVLVNERIGLRSLMRSWALTRGTTWRIIGVLILFVIVVGIATLATQFVTGTVFRLILGADNIATALFLAGITASVVSTILAVIGIVFITQLYVALVQDKDGMATGVATSAL